MVKVFGLLILCCCVPIISFGQVKIPLQTGGLWQEQAVTSATIAPDIRQDSTTIRKCSVATTASVTSSTTAVRGTSSTFSYPIHPKFGAMVNSTGAAWHYLRREKIRSSNGLGLADMVAENMPVYPVVFGSQGQFSHVAFAGVGARGNAVHYNGRPYNDPAVGAYHVEHFATEGIREAEILVGSDAAVLADDATGMVINIREQHYNASTPYSKLWYSQGGGAYTASDGIFSQNISEQVNVYAGYKAQRSQGEYQNSGVEGWNIRAGGRYSPSSSASIGISYLFTHQRVGVNGGINTIATADVTDVIGASVRYQDFREESLRHDITITGTAALADSSLLAHAALYYSWNEWLQWRGTNERLSDNDTTFSNIFATARLGATARAEMNIGVFSLFVGGTAERIASDASIYFPSYVSGVLSGFGKAITRIGEHVEASFGIRASVRNNSAYFNSGGKLRLLYGDSSAAFADISFMQRAASPSEFSTTELSSEKHTLIMLGIEEKHTFGSLSGYVFFRTIADAINTRGIYRQDSPQERTLLATEFFNDGARTMFGGGLQAEWNIGNFVFQSQQIVHLGDKPTMIVQPAWYGTVSGWYRYRLGNNVLSVGLRVAARSELPSAEYAPQQWAFVADNQQTNGFIYNGLDVLGSIELGSAIIRATFHNVLGTAYFTTPVMPVFNGVLRLGVTWAFMN